MLVALDLDRTLIYSRTSMGPVADDLGLRIVEWYDGAPLSHVTDRGWMLLGELMELALDEFLTRLEAFVVAAIERLDRVVGEHEGRDLPVEIAVGAVGHSANAEC